MVNPTYLPTQEPRLVSAPCRHGVIYRLLSLSLEYWLLYYNLAYNQKTPSMFMPVSMPMTCEIIPSMACAYVDPASQPNPQPRALTPVLNHSTSRPGAWSLETRIPA